MYAHKIQTDKYKRKDFNEGMFLRNMTDNLNGEDRCKIRKYYCKNHIFIVECFKRILWGRPTRRKLSECRDHRIGNYQSCIEYTFLQFRSCRSHNYRLDMGRMMLNHNFCRNRQDMKRHNLLGKDTFHYHILCNLLIEVQYILNNWDYCTICKNSQVLIHRKNRGIKLHSRSLIRSWADILGMSVYHNSILTVIEGSSPGKYRMGRF